jgi:ABC-type Fe3+ transport system substrate-binding protein
MPARRLTRAVRFAAGLLAGLALACSRPRSGRELVIISPHAPEIRSEFSTGFARWYRERTGGEAALRWLDVGGTGEAIEYVRSRNTGDRQAGGVDVFFGGGDFPYIQLRKQGLLAAHAVPQSVLSRIPRVLNGVELYQQDSSWYGAALSSFGIICNREIARRNGLPMPQTWADLARRECIGWVSSGDPRYSGTMHMMYELLLQAYGWERGWDVIMRLSANVQSFAKGAATAAKEVSTGQAAFGLAIDFYAFIEIQRYGAERLIFVLPEGQSVVNTDGIGILANAAEPALAAAFVDYVMSEGQKLWILRPGVPGGPVRHALCRYPVDPGLYHEDRSLLTVTGNPFEGAPALQYDSKLGGRRWALLGDMMAALVITPHDDLKRCWREIVRRGLTPRQYEQYLTVGIDEGEAVTLAETWAKPAFARKRIELMNAWTRRARRRYAEVFER